MCATLRRARNTLRDDGPAELVRRGFREVGLVVAYRELGRSRTFQTSADLVRFAETVGGGVVAPFQIKSEIVSLLDVIRVREPRVVLEIGTANGGTLLLFSRAAHAQATIVSVDLDGYPPWRIPVYKRFVSAGQTMHLVRADSHEASTKATVEALLEGRKIDFLFIDGDHSYAGAKSDFEQFGGLVGPGGLIAFHNIKDDTPYCQVSVFWNEVRMRYRHEEIVEDPNQPRRGIGLLYVDEGDGGFRPVPLET